MQEQDWPIATDPTPMLEALNGRFPERKYRLFICSVLRRLWPLLEHPDSQEAIAVVEKYARGQVRSREVQRVSRNAFAVYSPILGTGPRAAAANAAYCCTYLPPYKGHAVAQACVQDGQAACVDLGRSREEERQAQIRLLRCTFGNPFHFLAPDPLWLVWNEGIVERLARLIDEESRFADLPILADALEEAGCADQELLEHCRQPGPHTQACWAVDLLLGQHWPSSGSPFRNRRRRLKDQQK